MPLPRTATLAACAFASFAAGANAAGYPTRPIRFVVPFPPGGGGDITARSVSQRLAENLGQSVVIDNRGGGSTIIGTDVVAKAPPDGHTILIVTSTFAINPSLHPKLPYDSMRDLAPVTQLAATPYVVVVHPSLAATNIKELIALARAKPRQLSYASVGNGSATHLATEMFNAAAGTQITHVPYKGSGPALNDLVGGHVPIYFGSMPASMPQARAGRLRALAVTGAHRSPAAPELPTIAEAGLPGYAFTSWYGVVAPGGTSRAIVERLSAEMRKVLELKEVRDRLAADGSEPVGSMPDAFAALIKADIARYARIVQQAGIRAD